MVRFELRLPSRQGPQEAIPCEGQTFWQNMPTVLQGLYFAQQKSKQEAVAGYTRGGKGFLPGQACL